MTPIILTFPDIRHRLISTNRLSGRSVLSRLKLRRRRNNFLLPLLPLLLSFFHEWRYVADVVGISPFFHDLFRELHFDSPLQTPIITVVQRSSPGSHTAWHMICALSTQHQEVLSKAGKHDSSIHSFSNVKEKKSWQGSRRISIKVVF